MQRHRLVKEISASLFSSVVLLISAALSRGAEPRLVHIETAEKKLVSQLFEDIRRNHLVLDDGRIISVKKLQYYVSSLPVASSDQRSARNDAGEWRWVIDEDSVGESGLTFIATTVVEAIGECKYAIQHLDRNSYTETTIPNYILLIPWDKTKAAGAWVEGLAKPCGTLGYPIGHGVMVQKEAFEMVPTKGLDVAAFVESLKKGKRYPALISTETKCPVCNGSGRVRVENWIENQKIVRVPCQRCAATGKVKKDVPYAVAW